MNVSLKNYISTAREAGSGEVRLAKGTTDQLVNKGTLGNRMASFFQDGARAIGLMRPDPTRAQRQQDALDGFRAALEGHFGKEAADAALAATGLGNAAGLTGRTIIAAADHAKAVVAQHRAANLLGEQAFSAPGPGEDAGPGFARLAAGMKPPLDPAGLTAEQRLDYGARLRDSVQAESRLNREALGGDRLGDLAKGALKQTLKLAGADGIGNATTAREAYTAALKDALKGLAAGRDTPVLATRLAAATERLGAHLEAELIDEAGGADIQELTEKAMHHAMIELRAESPGLLGKAQANALKAGSPLQALCAAAMAVVGEAGYREDPASQEQAASATLLRSVATSLVSSLGSAIGPLTASLDDDVDRLNDDRLVPPAALQQARTALAAVL